MADVNLSPIGTTGIEHYRGEIREEWDREMQGRQATKIYREMEDNIAVIGAFPALIEFLMRQVTLRVDARNESAEAIDERDRIDESLNDMETSLHNFFSEFVTGLVYGFVPFEKVYKMRRGPEQSDPKLKSKYSDGRIAWRAWSIRPQDSLHRWEIDDHGDWLGMWQLPPNQTQEVFIPRSKLMNFVLRSRGGSPEGRSMLRSSVRSYRFLKGHEEFEANGAQKNLAGVLDAQVPIECFDDDNPDPEVQKMVSLRKGIEETIAKVHRNEYTGIVRPTEEMPDGRKTGFALKELQGPARPFDSDKAIRRIESRILISFLAEGQILGLDKHGSHALGDTKTTTVAMIVGALLGTAMEVINEEVTNLTMLNGRPAAIAPIVRHSDIEIPDLTHMASFLNVVYAHFSPTVQAARWLERYSGMPSGVLGEPKAQPSNMAPPSEPQDNLQTEESEEPNETPDDDEEE
jgi:hypothetical protein